MLSIELICPFLFLQDAYQTDCCKKMIICSNCVKQLKITSPNARFDSANSYTFSAQMRCPFCQTPKYRCIPNYPVRKIVEKFAVFMKNYEEERRLDALEGRRKAEEQSRKREEERKKKEAAEKAKRDEEEKKREEKREKERMKREEQRKKKQMEEDKKREEREKKKLKEDEAKRKKEQEKKRKEAEERKRVEQKKRKEEDKRKGNAGKSQKPEQKKKEKEEEKEENEEEVQRVLERGTQHTAWLVQQVRDKFYQLVNFSTLKTLCLLSLYFFSPFLPLPYKFF